MSQKRGVRLRTPENVRMELARVYRDARSGALPPDHARVCGYLLQTLAAVIRDVQAKDE